MDDSPSTPLLLCSLLQPEPISSENLLHVVIRALQSLENLFLSVPPLNQFRLICVFPKTKLQKPSLCGCRAHHACRAGTKRASPRALSARPCGSCRPAGSRAVTPRHQREVSGTCPPRKTTTSVLSELFPLLSPFIVRK